MSEQPNEKSDRFHDQTDAQCKKPDHYVYRHPNTGSTRVFRREDSDRMFSPQDSGSLLDAREYVDNAEMPDLTEARKKRHDTFHNRFVEENATDEAVILSGVRVKAKKKNREEKERPPNFPWLKAGNNVSALQATWLKMKDDNSLHSSGLPIYLQNIVTGETDVFDVEVNNYCKMAGLKYKTEKEDLLVEAAALKELCYEVMNRVDQLVENYNQRGVDN